MSTELWTMGQLTERVAASLRARRSQPVGEQSARSSKTTTATAPGAGQLNGRVREVPDARTVRWYQTTGIVDRPVTMRGRTALYGRRHLLQLLAIKRLQERGQSLAGIQAELAGASDGALARLAGEPEPTEESTPTASPVRGRTRFWAASPADPAPEAGADSGQSPRATVDVVGVRIAGGLTLLLDQPARPVSADDVAALRAAAAPLVQLIRQRDLLGPAQSAPVLSGEPDDPSERGKDHP